jgi:hypothetical protein
MDINIFLSLNKLRLIDVFITGPLHIIIASYLIKHTLLFYFMLITGILNIIYNGHNYLLFNNSLKEPISILKPFIHNKHGKYQNHRLYNLIIMYPIFTYLLFDNVIPYKLRFLLLINIIIGFTYNLYFYINYYKKRDRH